MKTQICKLVTKSLLSLTAAALLLGQAQAAVISLSPSTLTPGNGSNFSVDVLATGVFDAPHDGDFLLGFGFDVSALGAGAIDFLGFTVGPLFSPVVLPNTDVGGIVPPINATAEPLLLATLNFQATAPGVVVLSITADPLVDPNEGLQYIFGVDDIEASTTLTVGAAEVPEPGSVLLTAVGLVLVAMRFIKR